MKLILSFDDRHRFHLIFEPPGFTKRIDAFQLNGFFKLIGFDLFGTYEKVFGRTAAEERTRRVEQFAVDWVFRFGDNENLFIASRFNSVTAQLEGFKDNVTIDRVVMSAGYFFTRNILLKGEIVDQQYREFPQEDYRNNGKFKGYVIQVVVGF